MSFWSEYEAANDLAVLRAKKTRSNSLSASSKTESFSWSKSQYEPYRVASVPTCRGKEDTMIDGVESLGRR